MMNTNTCNKYKMTEEEKKKYPVIHEYITYPFKRQTKIAADDILFFFTFIFRRKYDLIFHVNPLPSIGFT